MSGPALALGGASLSSVSNFLLLLRFFTLMWTIEARREDPQLPRFHARGCTRDPAPQLRQGGV